MANEMRMYGKTVNEMTKEELSELVQSVADSKRKNGGSLRARNLQLSPEYKLVGLPVVTHVLTQQDNGDTSGSPTATAAQITFVNDMTNRLFKIYDKASQTDVQWASFVESQTVYHDTLTGMNYDCNSLTSTDYNNIITSVAEWQFKLHNIICESNQWSGKASFPSTYSVTNVLHNMIRCEYRALACYDDLGNFLCAQTGGQNISHTRWWRTVSKRTTSSMQSFDPIHCLTISCARM